MAVIGGVRLPIGRGDAHSLAGGEFAGVELVHMGVNEQAGKVGECHECGSGIDARSSDHDLALDDGDLQNSAIERCENPGFRNAVVHELAAAAGALEFVLGDAPVGFEIHEFLFAEKFAGEEFFGALVVPANPIHGEARALDLGIDPGAFVDEILVVDRHERFAFFDLFAGLDMDGGHLAADLGFHLDLEGGSDLAGEREDGFDAGADDLRAGWRVFCLGVSGQEGNPIHPPSRSGEGNKKGGEEFQIHA